MNCLNLYFQLPSCSSGSVTFFDGDENGRKETVCGDNLIAFRSSQRSVIMHYKSTSTSDRFNFTIEEFSSNFLFILSKISLKIALVTCCKSVTIHHDGEGYLAGVMNEYFKGSLS